MRLFLFDIDGTLIYAHNAGRTCLLRAMQSVFGTTGDHAGFDWRGRTDPQIVSELMRGAGVREEVIRARLEDCFAAYAHCLAELIDSGHPVDVHPGIREILAALSTRTDSLVGLLTGNVESGAKLKLKPTGLLPYFRVGAYGSDDSDRRKLPTIALERAQVLVGQTIPSSRLVIIGDTPLDIDCARAAGASAVAVATGHHSMEELAAHSPDLLLKNFAAVEESLRALTSL
jgi:phosphoglycolate phosphatase